MSIELQNLWWVAERLWDDRDLKKVRQSKIKYHPSVFTHADFLSRGVFTLRGPRRVGKTISLKLFVADLIERHKVNPKHIVWSTLDTIRTLERLEAHALELLEKYKPKLLIFDEITSVKNWQKLIKKLRDIGILENVTVILTGSSAHDLKRGAERMAGRRGEINNPDRVLLPMDFSEFKKQILNSSKKIKNEEICLLYLEYGGFPFVVDALLKSNFGEPAFESDEFLKNLMPIFDDVIFYEFTRRKLDRSIGLEVIARLSQTQTTNLSFESFAKPLSSSRDTVRKYLEALGDSFLLTSFQSFDTSKNRPAPKKDRKFLWVDPALGKLAKFLEQGEEWIPAACAEILVGAHLVRLFETRVFEGLSSPRSVFTWKSQSGNDIDFLVVNRGAKFNFPVEVKYQNTISDWDFVSIERGFKAGGFLVTKEFEKTRDRHRALSLREFLCLKAGDFGTS